MNTRLVTSRLRVIVFLLLVLGLVFLIAPTGTVGGLYSGSLQSCTTHCDCQQGEFCYKGTCLRDPKQAVYCCSKPGCMPGNWCVNPDGSSKGRCEEDPNWFCEDTCGCGPAHACMEVPGVGKTCVKDVDDPWLSGASIFSVEVPPGEPTYCCSVPSCYAGRTAYGESTEFACYDSTEGVIRDACGGASCYYSGDCKLGESCVDTRFGSTADPGTSCSLEGGFCTSNAIAEAVFGWSPSDLVPSCEDISSPGQKCEIGWQPGGKYAVQQVIGTYGSCGNAICEGWESPITCSADCTCGDETCSNSEFLGGNCPADCGTCGDEICTFPETPKNCPSDCPVEFGDGSCSSVEVDSGILTDCGCADSKLYLDYPAMCGDGVCQPFGNIPENFFNCEQDCPDITPPIISYSLNPAAPDGNGDWYRSNVTLTWDVTEPETPNSLVKTGCDDQSITTDQDEINYSCSSTSNGGPAGPVDVTIKRDATSPVVVVTGVGDGDMYHLLMVPTAGCSTTDDLSGVFTEATPSVTGGTLLGVGVYTATCSGAEDYAGNQANDVLATYSVVFEFTGFFPPISNPDVMNKVKAGNAVPVKFDLAGNQGLTIFALGSPTSVPIACESWAAPDTIDETVTAGSSSLSYDGSQYIYVWKTNKAWAGTCRQLQVKLIDGKTYTANFLFMK